MQHGIRSSDVFLKADIAAILRALALAAQAHGDGGEFTRGYRTALAAVAVALNIAPGDVMPMSARCPLGTE